MKTRSGVRLLSSALVLSLLSAAAAQSTVNIGYSGPLSGGAAFYGKDVQTGLDMAIDEINKAGGITVAGKKVKLNLVSLDDKYLPNETATNARRLLQQSNTPVIFVPHSGGIQTLQAFNTRDPEFLLVAYSSEPKILEANNKLTFMIPPSYDAYLEPFAKNTIRAYGKRLGLIGTTSAYGKAWTEAMAAEWKKQGGTVLANNGVDYNTTVDYTAAVTKTLADKPDVLFVGGPSQPTALVMKAARDQGFKGGFIVMDQAKFEQIDTIVPAAQLEGAIGVMPLRDYRGTGAQRFVKTYQSIYKTVPTAEAALNYMGVYIVARAMELAGTTSDPSAIRAKLPQAAKELPASRNLYQISGVDEKGHMGGQLIMGMYKNGRLTQIKQ